MIPRKPGVGQVRKEFMKSLGIAAARFLGACSRVRWAM